MGSTFLPKENALSAGQARSVELAAILFGVGGQAKINFMPLNI